MSTKSEIMAIARDYGYEGADARTTMQALDILADALAGEDVATGRSISAAIRVIAEYLPSEEAPTS